jgi:hypothetical protein
VKGGRRSCVDWLPVCQVFHCRFQVHVDALQQCMNQLLTPSNIRDSWSVKILFFYVMNKMATLTPVVFIRGQSEIVWSWFEARKEKNSKLSPVHVCWRAMLYQERDLPCHVTNFTIFGTKCLFQSNWLLYLANRWRSRWDTTDAAVESVHSGEFPLHLIITLTVSAHLKS